MKQVRSEISVEDGKWNASVWLEGWALYPEDGPKIPPGTPGDPNTAGNDWLKTLNAADQQTMREVAEYFLGETFILTLALVVLGLISVPSYIVEPAIALSIAYVGIENLWTKELKPWRVAFVFALGLLHGMGFASVMKELDIPQGQVLKPLVGFNLGVETGQVTVLAAAFAATFWLFRKPEAWNIFRKIASGMIGAVGLYWTVERIRG